VVGTRPGSRFLHAPVVLSSPIDVLCHADRRWSSTRLLTFDESTTVAHARVGSALRISLRYVRGVACAGFAVWCAQEPSVQEEEQD
jgi:hypothetical protein